MFLIINEKTSNQFPTLNFSPNESSKIPKYNNMGGESDNPNYVQNTTNRRKT